MENVSFEILLGQTIAEIQGAKSGSQEILFTLTDGRRFRMSHFQDCCESVSVEDICGDVGDLIGLPIGLAEKVSRADRPADVAPKEYEESPEWTFYKLATHKGAVTIRWYGNSNGYYSTGVDFEQVEGETAMSQVENTDRETVSAALEECQRMLREQVEHSRRVEEERNEARRILRAVRSSLNSLPCSVDELLGDELYASVVEQIGE